MTNGLAIEVTDGGVIVTAEGLVLEQHEQERLHDAVRAELLRIAAARETAPYPMHLEPTFREEAGITFDALHPAAAGRDPDGVDPAGQPFWRFTETLPANGAETCPDCGRHIQAGNSPSVAFTFLACPSIAAGPLPPADRPCHPGCLVACGVNRG